MSKVASIECNLKAYTKIFVDNCPHLLQSMIFPPIFWLRSYMHCGHEILLFLSYYKTTAIILFFALHTCYKITINIVIPTALHSLHSLSQTNKNTWRIIECKGKNFSHRNYKNQRLSKKKFKRKKGKYSRIVCLTLPLQTRKNYIKLLPYLQSKKLLRKIWN